MSTKNFTKINEAFTCEHCTKVVPKAKSTCRNHCPFCLYSKHVDHMPGDRANQCQGLLEPISYDIHPKKGLMILFSCQKCGSKTRNIAITDDPIAGDNYDLILSLNPTKI